MVGSVGQPAGLHVGPHRAQRGHRRVAVPRRPATPSRAAGGWWSRTGWARPSGRQEKRGRPVSARLSFSVVPGRRTAAIRSPSGAGSAPSGSRSISRYGSQAPSTTRAATCRPSASTTPLAAPPSRVTAVTGVPVRIGRPGGAGGVGEGARDGAHAALGDHPGAVRAGQPAHVVHQEVVPGARVVRAGVEPGEAVGDRVHADQQLGAEVEAGQVVGDRAADQVDEDLPQRRAGRTARRSPPPAAARPARPGRGRRAARPARPACASSAATSAGEKNSRELRAGSPRGRCRTAGTASRRRPAWAGSSAGRGAAPGCRTSSVASSSGGISPSRYEPVEWRSPGTFGNGFSVRVAPPITSAASSTSTSRPARASRTAETSPLCPAPTITTSARAGRSLARSCRGQPSAGAPAAGQRLGRSQSRRSRRSARQRHRARVAA